MKLKKYLFDYGLLILSAGMIVLLDQWSKGWVRANLAYGEIYQADSWITQYARILHWRNTGSAFGLFPSLGGVITALSFIVTAAILYYFPQMPRQDWLLRLAMTLQLGGATGNLVDRLIQGHVTDFISVGNFPVFNVADASISTGVAVLILGIFLKEREEKKKVAQENANLGNPPHQQDSISNPRNLGD